MIGREGIGYRVASSVLGASGSSSDFSILEGLLFILSAATDRYLEKATTDKRILDVTKHPVDKKKLRRQDLDLGAAQICKYMTMPLFSGQRNLQKLISMHHTFLYL